MTYTAFLMRHATPDWTRTDLRYDIPPGPPLTPHGEEEARAAAEFLTAHSITHIFASPLERTRRTAEIIADILNLPWQIENTLAEWREDEDEQTVTLRSRTFWDDYWMSHFVNETTAADQSAVSIRPLFVTHGGPSRLLLQSLGLDPQHMEHFRAQFDQENPMPPAGIWRLQRAPGTDIWRMNMVFSPSPHIPYNAG